MWITIFLHWATVKKLEICRKFLRAFFYIRLYEVDRTQHLLLLIVIKNLSLMNNIVQRKL